MRKERNDVVGGIYIKDKNGNALVEGQDIKERWRSILKNY